MTVAEMRVEILDQLQEFYTDNNRIQPADILRVINQYYVEVARRALCFSRTAEITWPQDEEGQNRPADMVKIRSVRYGTTLLQATTVDYLDALNTGWRDAASGVPTHFFVRATQKINLYPKPSSQGSVYVEGWVYPSYTWTGPLGPVSPAPTVTKVAAQTTLAGVNTQFLNGYTRVGGRIGVPGGGGTEVKTVVSIAGDTALTVDSPWQYSASAQTGVFYWLPPLVTETQAPFLPAEYHMLLVYGSVFLLGTRKLLDNQAAQLRAMAAKSDYEELFRDFPGYNRRAISLQAPGNVR